MKIKFIDLFSGCGGLTEAFLNDKRFIPLKIIDNEFLGYSTGWILNIKNSFLKEDFVYQNFVSTEALNLLWNIRKEWSKKKLSFLC